MMCDPSWFCSTMLQVSAESQSMQTIYNCEFVLKMRKVYTYASKYVVFPQYLNMGLGFGNLWDNQCMFWATRVLKLNFWLNIVSFDKYQDCAR